MMMMIDDVGWMVVMMMMIVMMMIMINLMVMISELNDRHLIMLS